MSAKGINRGLVLYGERVPGFKMNYYLRLPDGKRGYAFSRDYTEHTYELCKSGIRIGDLLSTRSRDRGIMLLVKYTLYMMPYLQEYYGLEAA